MGEPVVTQALLAHFGVTDHDALLDRIGGKTFRWMNFQM